MDTANRYSRQEMLAEIGPEGQRQLSMASVLIVGVGGLGSAAAIYLTGAGIGHIGLADPDEVSLSNLQRQVLYDEDSVGQYKTHCARRRLNALSSHTLVEIYPEGLTPQNAAKIIVNYDIVVDCTDNYATRLLIDDTCASLGKPWIYGSISEFSGQLAVMNFRRGRRYRDLYPDIETLYNSGNTVNGVIGPVPGVIGALEACEVIKMAAGFGDVLDGQLFCIDFKNLNTNIFEF